MIYPRLLALAEVAWTNPEQKDWKRFHAEALQEVKVLNSMGYHTFDLQNEVGNRPVALSVDNHLAKGKKVYRTRGCVWTNEIEHGIQKIPACGRRQGYNGLCFLCYSL